MTYIDLTIYKLPLNLIVTPFTIIVIFCKQMVEHFMDDLSIFQAIL